MMFLYPDLVDMAALGDGPLAPKMKPPDGIGGLDPREHASAEVGRRNVQLAAEAIGKKARELLEGLPPRPKDAPVPGLDIWESGISALDRTALYRATGCRSSSSTGMEIS